jgi:hypothetical protein
MSTEERISDYWHLEETVNFFEVSSGLTIERLHVRSVQMLLFNYL